MIQVKKTDPVHALAHLALFYRGGEGALAAGFFRAIGCVVQDMGPLNPDGSVYKVLMNAATPDDQYIYISPAQPEQIAFELRLREFLGDGEEQSFEALRAFKAREPEMIFHAGLRYPTLDELEDAILNLDAFARAEGLEDRIGVLRFRPRLQDDSRINDRIARSPVFKMDDRPSFGSHNIQVFINTDLFAADLLILGQTIEIGYIFPKNKIPKAIGESISHGARGVFSV